MTGVTGPTSTNLPLSALLQSTEATQTTTETEGTAPDSGASASRPILIPVNFGLSSIGALGINQPRAPEDVSALIAAITLALEETVKETRDNRAVGLAGGLRSALGTLFGNLTSMLALSEARTQLETSLTTKTAERDAKTQQKNGLELQSAALNGQISSLDGQISSLNQQIAIAQANKQPTDGLIAQRDAKVAERNNLAQQKAGIDGQIGQLGTEIGTLNTEIEGIQASIAQNVSQYNSIQSILFNVFIQALLAVAVQKPGEEVVTEDRDTKVKLSLEDLAEALRKINDDTNIREIVREFQVESRQIRESEERVAEAAFALLTATVDVLATLASLDLPLDSEIGKSAAQNRGRVRVAI